MRYLLDTSILVDYLRKKQKIFDFFSHHQADQFTTSTICAFELFDGVHRMKLMGQEKVVALLQSLSDIIPFSYDQARIAGKIRAALFANGTPIEDIDVFIAAATMDTDATLLTNNTKHFSRIPGLDLASI